MRNNLKPIFLIIALISLCFYPFTLAGSQDIPEGFLAPDFKLRDLKGQTFLLSNFKNRHPVILFFWTTWCPYCRSELITLNERYPKLIKDGWELLAINIAESETKIIRFLRNYALTFTVLIDRYADAADSYGIFGVPTYFLVDTKGYIVFSGNSFPERKYKEITLKEEKPK